MMHGITNNACLFAEVSFNSEWDRKFAMLLCNTNDRYKEFLYNFYKEDEIRDSLFNYRSYQLTLGRGQAITCEDINKLIEVKDYNTLHILLEELFLEALPENSIELFMKAIKRGRSVDRMLKRHQTMRELRLGRIIL